MRRRGAAQRLHRSQKDHPQLPPIFTTDAQLVEVVLGVVAKDVERLAKKLGRRSQHRQVVHDVAQGGLVFMRQRRRQLPPSHVKNVLGSQPVAEDGVVQTLEEVGGKVVQHGGLVERERTKPLLVKGGLARPAALCRPSVPLLQLAGDRALPVEVDGPEGEVIEETIPSIAL